MLQKFGIARTLATRPVVSLLLAAAFLALGAGFYTGRIGGSADYAESGRGEALVMALSCAVIGGYFLRAALLGWRQVRDPPSRRTQ